MSQPTLRIATRRSQLALWQTQHVADKLKRAHPSLAIELVPLSTRGDEILDKPLAKIGGKGLFLKALEVAMLEGKADIAAHSLKDVPAELEPGFALSAILPRADASDAFVSTHYTTLEDLPAGARVGTSSLRRQAQVRALRPDIQLLDLRGNVNTRLAKLDQGQYEAIILATAGLTRLDLGHRISTRLTPPDWLPAPGQAAIAIETRANDTTVAPWLEVLHDDATDATTRAERAMNACLGGSCTVPIGGYAELDGPQLTLSGLVGDVESGRLFRSQAQGHCDDPVTLGHTVARQLLDQGAGQFLTNVKI